MIHIAAIYYSSIFFSQWQASIWFPWLF